MAVKPLSKLSLIDIVTRADAGIIREALEARIKIDDLLVIREEAYKKIFDIENEIEDVIGEEGAFNFGDAPYPVAGMAKKKPRPKPTAVKPAVEEPEEVPEKVPEEVEEKAEDSKPAKKPSKGSKK
jgi:hypothetical protein